MYDVSKGDIVTVIKSVYIDFPGGNWADHFVDKKVYFRAIESASNNGNFKAIDSKGRLFWLNRIEVIDLK